LLAPGNHRPRSRGGLGQAIELGNAGAVPIALLCIRVTGWFNMR